MEQTRWLDRYDGLMSTVLRELYGGLWHCTHTDRFKSICQRGAILPDPPIPEDQRWSTSRGPDYYPFVRWLGGVSLFDLDQFDPDSEKYGNSSWGAFIPYRSDWGHSIWVEIDRERVSDQLISPADLVTRWKAANSNRKFMPQLEAAHLGPIPLAAFKRAFLVTRGEERISPIPLAVVVDRQP